MCGGGVGGEATRGEKANSRAPAVRVSARERARVVRVHVCVRVSVCVCAYVCHPARVVGSGGWVPIRWENQGINESYYRVCADLVEHVLRNLFPLLFCW